MKKYQLHTKTDDLLNRFPALRKPLEVAARRREGSGAPRGLCLGADLEKAGVGVAVQGGLGTPVHRGTLTRARLLALGRVLLGRGGRSVVGLEAGGFGGRGKTTVSKIPLTKRHITGAGRRWRARGEAGERVAPAASG